MLRIVLTAVFALAAAGCSSVYDRVKPYRIDVRQGNFVTEAMVSQVKPGMTKDQVRFALGTPLLNDVFHADRWDYVYRFQPGIGPVEQRHVTVLFADGVVQRLEGDLPETPALPAGADAGAPAQAR
ncbi:MAG: outer membrane protein assembly factor BamE [Zoogloea sp.]|nr:outer membrane protein assembly factor BamE [Zoogloea sp.]